MNFRPKLPAAERAFEFPESVITWSLEVLSTGHVSVFMKSLDLADSVVQDDCKLLGNGDTVSGTFFNTLAPCWLSTEQV